MRAASIAIILVWFRPCVPDRQFSPFHSCYKSGQVRSRLQGLCRERAKASVTGNTSSEATAAVRLDAIKTRMAEAARNAGRAPEDVTLVAVSKTFDEAAIRPLIAAGQRVFGENRVQESAHKWPALRAQHADIELHLIGPLQTNKVDDALALFDVIHTLDRDRLALALVRAREKGKALPRLLVQVNTEI